jgi:hypothetical protein
MTFNRTVYLTLPLPRALMANESARIGWFDEKTAEWIPLPSAVKGLTVTTAIKHFTAFAVLIGSSADNAAFCGFAACGGDPKGAWMMVSSCIGGQDQAHAACVAAGDTTSWSHSYVTTKGTLNLDPAKTLGRDPILCEAE